MDFSPINIRTISRLGSCGAYGLAAMEIPEMDNSMIACTADLCFYSGLDRFKQKFPDRLYNVGIAEQNLVGIAAGLAKEGFNPFVSTYASFATTRALDQVRVNMGYMKLPIKLIGLTSGLSVGILGATHMSIEDVAIMRSIPNITVISPADCTETAKTILALANYDKPVYVRLTGPMNNPPVYKEDYDFSIGKANIIKTGSDIAIIACGTMVYNSVKASQLLEENGISAAVIDMHTIKPLDKECLESLKNYKLLVTVEEHSVIGGLGSAVSEYYAGSNNHLPHLIIGIDDYFAHAADYQYLIDKYELKAEHIFNKILNKYKEL